MSNGVVFLQTVNRGIANPEGREPIVYFGKVFRIPRSDHDTIRQLEWEPTAGELLCAVRGGDGKPLTPATQTVIERLEMYDQDTGDVWVMYRVPYREQAI